MIFGIFIAAVTIVCALANLTSPLRGGAPDVVKKVHDFKIGAIPFGVAGFFIIIAFPRPAFLKRAPLAILAACFCWLIAWNLLFYSFYLYLHTQSIDLYKVLQNAKPH